MSESRSTPITRTCLALPPRTMSEASATPWQKPAQAAEMSNAAAWSVPSSWAIAVAIGRGLQQVRDGGDDDAVDLARLDAGALERLPRDAATDIICTVSSGPAQRRSLDAGALLDPLVAGVDRARRARRWGPPGGPVGADAEDRGACLRRAGSLSRGARASVMTVDPLGVQAHQRLAGRDQVAVLDEPLDDRAAVRRGDDRCSSRRLATAPTGARGRGCRRRAGRRSGGRCPWRARRASARSGWSRSCEASPCLSTNARASSSWSGVLSANVSTPLSGALGDPGQGAGRRHLEDAGDAEVGHRLHAEVPAHRAGDLGDDPVEHLAAVVDDLAVAVGDQRGARVVGRDRRGPAWPSTLDGRAPCARCGTRRRPTAGSAGPWRAGRRRSAASCSMVPAATIWPGPLSLAAVRPCFVDRGEHLVAVAAEDRGHAGGGRLRRRAAIALPRSRTSTIACSAVIARAPAAAASSPTLWPATAPIWPNASAGCGNSSRAASRPEATSSGWATAVSRIVVGVRLGAVVGQVEAGDRGQPGQAFARRSGSRPRGSGSRESGRPGRERR